MKTNVLIYGALGYMGQLTARYANEARLPVVLAARSPDLTKLAETMGVESRMFGLADAAGLQKQLTDVAVVVNLAGPFSATSRPLIEACIATGTHYIDIAGEYPDFETAYSFTEAARKAGVMLMPGAGFGVVPTDIAALLAHRKLPDATELTIAYATVGGASQGTLKTVLKDIDKPGVTRQNGQFVPIKPAAETLTFWADGKDHIVVTNPWRADLFTAFYSTGIPTIRTFSAFPGFVVGFMKGRMLWLRDLLLNRLVGLLPVGPNEKQLQTGKTHVWATAKNATGQTATVQIDGPEAYLFSVRTVLAITSRILAGDAKPGFQTPAHYGAALIENMDGVTIR